MKNCGFFLLFFTLNCFADIREIMSIKEILDYVDTDTLVVFDIDNTVIEPTGYLGSDQWFYYLIDKIKEGENISELEASNKAVAIWNFSQSLISTKLVETNTDIWISQMREKGAKIMAHTARDASIAAISREQLWANNVNFSINAPYNHDIFLASGASYSQGILFQGEGNDKGAVLVEFLKQLNLQPKKIIFIDDRKSNIINMFNALSILTLEHIEFRYGGADEHVRSFLADFSNSEMMPLLM